MSRRSDINEWFNEFAREASAKLPQGYDLTININSDEARIDLTDENGDDVEICRDDLNFLESMEELIVAARRRADGKASL